MSLMDRLSTWGFDPSRVAFALRTAFAACLALWLAKAMGLQHPQWAAMSVWAASQPLRGQLLEKSFFRLAGTLVGTGVGLALAVIGQAHLGYLVAGLALWVGLCTGVAQLWRGYLSYGGVLAGYSAAMVSLLDIGHPENLAALGLDRLATVLTGVIVVTLIGLPFSPKGAVKREGALALLVEGLVMLSAPKTDTAARTDLVARIAQTEEGLDAQAAGSRQTRATAAAVRAALLALTGALLAPAGAALPWQAVAQAARVGDWATAARILDMAGEADFAVALRALSNGGEVMPRALHRDWFGAGEAAFRAALAVAVVGGIWVVTGFAGGNFMLLGLSVMISVFAAMENPVAFMRHVVIGQLVGIAAMLVARWIIWPLVPSEGWLIATMVPFVFMGGALTAHRKTMFLSLDANMVFLLLLQPVWPLHGDIVQSLTLAGGVVSAPLLAWAMYWLIFPANLPRRIVTLERMMQRDLARMAAEEPGPHRLARWQSRLSHRVMRLIRMGERAGQGGDQALALAATHLRAGEKVQSLHLVVGNQELPHDARLSAAQNLVVIAHDPAAALARAA